jgi:DNA-binding transcriptional regulator PaaX
VLFPLPQDVLIARFLSRIGIEVVGLVEEAIHSFAALDILLYYMRDVTAHSTIVALAEEIGRQEAEISDAMHEMVAAGIFDSEVCNNRGLIYSLAIDSTRLSAIRSLVEMYETDINFRLWLVGKLLQVSTTGRRAI